MPTSKRVTLIGKHVFPVKCLRYASNTVSNFDETESCRLEEVRCVQTNDKFHRLNIKHKNVGIFKVSTRLRSKHVIDR